MQRPCFLIYTVLLLLIVLAPEAMGLTYPLTSGNEVVGQLQSVTVGTNANISDLSRKYQVGFFEFQEVNPKVDLKHLWPGTKLIVPTKYVLPDAPHKGIVINTAELRLYYYPLDKKEVMTYPIGIGRIGASTPTLVTTIINKVEHPDWRPTKETRAIAAVGGTPLPKVVPAGPDNPLGDYAMRLGEELYLIHGTNDPTGVGLRSSAGCIRMFPESIEELFSMAQIGTPVTIVNQPVKFGWEGYKLYMESHKPLTPDAGSPQDTIASMDKLLMPIVKKRKGEINWEKVLDAFKAETGVPVMVGAAKGIQWDA
jgi:L,D-transpeptidase ErfK/SrfK